MAESVGILEVKVMVPFHGYWKGLSSPGKTQVGTQ